jgi:hypothetical protein
VPDANGSAPLGTATGRCPSRARPAPRMAQTTRAHSGGAVQPSWTRRRGARGTCPPLGGCLTQVRAWHGSVQGAPIVCGFAAIADSQVANSLHAIPSTPCSPSRIPKWSPLTVGTTRRVSGSRHSGVPAHPGLRQFPGVRDSSALHQWSLHRPAASPPLRRLSWRRVQRSSRRRL